MKSEDLVRVLSSHSKIEELDTEGFCKLDSTGHFVRHLTFSIGASEFKIIWYPNQMTLETDSGLNVMFNHVEVSGTWPNEYKTNLQFRDSKDEMIAVIGLEKYKEHSIY